MFTCDYFESVINDTTSDTVTSDAQDTKNESKLKNDKLKNESENESENKTNDLTNSPDVKNKSIVDCLKEAFPDSITHMKKIISAYKQITDQIFSFVPLGKKNMDDVLGEIKNASTNIDMEAVMKTVSMELTHSINGSKLFDARVETIPKLIDAAYIYTIWHYDSTAPVVRLPANIYKYILIAKTCRMPCDELYKIFYDLISNSLLYELRIKEPPITMRTELSPIEINKQINTQLIPIIKRMLELILKLKKIDLTEEDKTLFTENKKISKKKEELPDIPCVDIEQSHMQSDQQTESIKETDEAKTDEAKKE